MTLDPNKQKLLASFERLLESAQEFDELGGSELLEKLAPSKPTPSNKPAPALLFGPREVHKLESEGELSKEPLAKQTRHANIESKVVTTWNEEIRKHLNPLLADKWRVVSSCYDKGNDLIHVFLEREI